MPVAIMIVAIVFLFAATLLTLNENLTRNVSLKIDTEDALQIAEAGYNHYMYYLNQDSTFYQNKDGISVKNGSVEVGFKPSEFDSDDYPLKYEPTAYMRGSDIIGYYEIRLIQPNVEEDLTVISTGYTFDKENIKRTVSVKIHQRSFANYVDFSDQSGDVYWTTRDEAYGPVFCNGDLNIKGDPIFHDEVIIGGRINRESGNPQYDTPPKQNYRPLMTFPITNDEIELWGKSSEGLYFEGRTCIFINDDELVIRNKKTDSRGNVISDDVKTMGLPDCGVIFVNDGVGDNKGNVFISGKLDGRLTVYAKGNIFITGKNPTVEDPSRVVPNINSNTGGIIYKDTNIPDKDSTGKSFSDDMLGLIAEGDIIIATRSWPDSSSKGYTKDSRDESNIAVKNITVYGALMTNQAGKQIKVEDYDDIDPKGNFTVYGSKIQNAVRGAVGTFNNSNYSLISGYSKVNYFDYRFKNQTPPHFITPANSGWEVKAWDEIPNP